MPKIEMPTPPPEEKQIIPDSGNGSDKELIKELLDEAPEENISTDIVDIEERDIPSEDDVFDDPPSIKPLKEPEFSELPEDKKGKRKYTRKAPMSEKQKAHLERIRKIAQEKKKAERERKIKEKEEAQLKKVEDKLRKEKEKAETINKPPPAQPRPQFNQEVEYKEKQLDKHYQQSQYFTKEDLDNAVLGAVATYDKYRKQQKKEKKERLIKEEADRKMRDTIQRAIQPQSAPSDPWRNLFT